MGTFKILRQVILFIFASALIIGCGSGGGSSSQTSQNASLSFDGANYGITTGGINKVTLSLIGSSSADAQTVSISSSDPTVAVVEKNECVLVNAPGYVNKCEVTLRGVSNGSTSLNASVVNNGSFVTSLITSIFGGSTAAISVPITVSDAYVAGTLAFASSNFNIVGGYEQQTTLTLKNSSGIKDAVATIISNNPNVIVKTSKCILSSEKNSCSIFLKGGAVGSVGQLTASLSEANSGNYSPIIASSQVNVIADKVVPGTLSFNINPILNYNNANVSVLQLSLNNSSNISGLNVSLNFNGSAVYAKYGGSGCTLSTQNPTCTIGLTPANVGITTITATVSNFAGYAPATSIVTVKNGSPTPPKNSLIFSQSKESITVGNSQDLTVSTNDGAQPEIAFNVSASSVKINTGKANPSKCDANEPCNIKITGISAGTATITASATNYTGAKNIATATSSPNPTPNYGLLSFSQNQYTATAGSTKNLTVELSNSSGVDNLNISFSAPSGITIDNSQSCVLSTITPSCTVQAQISSSASGSYAITAQSDKAIGLTSSSTIEVTPSAMVGVSLSTQMMAFPYGYNYATTPQQIVTITLDGINPNDGNSYKVFFDINSNANAGIWQTSSTSPTSPDSQQFVTLNSSNNYSANVTVVPQSATTPVNTYPITFYVVDNSFSTAPPYSSSAKPSTMPPQKTGFTEATLNVYIAKPVAEQRTFTVKNNCPFTVYPAMSGGATWFALSSAPTVGGYCDDTNTTIYSGESNASNNTYQCFWANPTPSANTSSGQNSSSYQLSANSSLQFIINPGSVDIGQNGWSGGITARALNDANTTWLLGDCSGNQRTASSNPSNEGCGSSSTKNSSGIITGYGQVGFSSPTSNVEFTLSTINQDTYDVQLITGVGIPVSMKPTGISASATNPYTNGEAGSTKAQSGSLKNSSGITYNLYGASWIFTEPSTTNINASAYNYVSGTSANNTPCSSSTPCSSTSTGPVCGYTYDAFSVGNASTYKTTCGYRLAYLTPDAVWKGNPDMNMSSKSNTAPFSFYSSAGSSQSVSLQLSDFYECSSASGGRSNVIKTAYGASTTNNACGATVWSNAPATANINQTNQYWLNSVLPNITWIKTGCPTCYSYPYDDPSSTFQAYKLYSKSNPVNSASYTVTFCPSGSGLPKNYWQK